MVRRISSVIFCTVIWTGYCTFSIAAPQELNGSAAISSQELLPAGTKAWISIPDSRRLDKKFLETQFGQMTKNEALEPFIASLKEQFKNWLNEKNVRLGLKLENIEDIRSGEICIAGIFPDNVTDDEKNLGRGSHGMVLLVDVSGKTDETNELLAKLSDELIARGATKEEFEAVQGAEVSKWKFPKKSRLMHHRYAYHTVTGGWLLSSDNENIFREIVRRLVNINNVKQGQTLAAQPVFQSVMQQVKLEGVESEIYWFVNPFGYVQLAQAMAREEQEFNQTNSDDWGRILRENGFDGFKGVGGTISLATDKHEVLHRTYVYKPDVKSENLKRQRVFGLFDFENKKQFALTPPAYVPDSVAGFFCASWDMQRALKNIGHAVDTFVFVSEKEGSFEDALDSLRVDLNVDVTEVISKFDNELSIISDSELPIREDSERIAIAIRLNGDADYVFDNIRKCWPQQHREFELCGYKAVEIDDSIGVEELELELEGDPFRDPGLMGEEEAEVEEPTFSLFARRYCVVTEQYLLIGNNQQYLEKLLTGLPDKKLTDATDYQRVADALDEMTDNTRVSFRQFSRLDRVIRPNYEMMREGKMAASDTILARLLNQAFVAKNRNSDKPREQKIDGSKLPADFDGQVAPYFGPAGWVMETTKDGWLFTGCLLERKDEEIQVVRIEDANSVHK